MSEKSDKRALQAGIRQAAVALRRRGAVLRARKTSHANLPRSRTAAPAAAAMVTAPALARLGGPAPSGVLVAEGDSWFDYPFNDVLSLLEDEHGFDVESVAHAGDRVEDMAYSDGQLDAFSRHLEKVLRRGDAPQAILLSGGGNDVTGDALAMMLDHVRSPSPGLNADIVRGLIDVRARNAYLTLIAAVSEICRRNLNGKTVPIVVHGYDYPVPDGRGFMGGWGPLPGPWLEPGLRAKGHVDLTKNMKLLATLIDRFNAMLSRLKGVPGLGHVRYVDLRNTLSTGSNYKRWWANELHPTATGFSAVAAKIAGAI